MAAAVVLELAPLVCPLVRIGGLLPPLPLHSAVGEPDGVVTVAGDTHAPVAVFVTISALRRMEGRSPMPFGISVLLL